MQLSHKTALVVIDMQKDFLAEGMLAVPGGDQILPVINQVIELFPHVILTQDWHPRCHASFASSYPRRNPFDRVKLDYGEQILWPDHCIQGEKGAEFADDLCADRAELVLRKGFRQKIDSYSAFFENDRTTPTGLAGYLRERGIDCCFLVGLAYDVCVRFSAEDGASLGFKMTIIEDGCASLEDSASDQVRISLNKQNVSHVRSSEICLNMS